jgi:hypothetical protein
MFVQFEAGVVVQAFGENAASGRKKYANLIVAERNGKKYVKTENDGETPDDLLSQDGCE